jgi:hypothetical protein
MRRARRRDEKDSYAMRADAAVLRSHCGLLTRAGQEIWVAHDIGVENGRPLSRWCSSSAKTRTHPAKLQRSRGPARGQPRGHGPQPRGHRRRGRLGLTAEPSGGRPSLQNLTLRSCSQAYVHASTPPIRRNKIHRHKNTLTRRARGAKRKKEEDFQVLA